MSHQLMFILLRIIAESFGQVYIMWHTTYWCRW